LADVPNLRWKLTTDKRLGIDPVANLSFPDPDAGRKKF
jgi:hypothetical protein